LPTKFQWAFNRTIRNLDIWENFQEIFVVKTGRAKLRCIYCRGLLAHPLLSTTDPNALGTATTTTLTRHLKRCSKAPKVSQSESESINPTTVKEFFTKPSANTPLTERDVLEKIVQYFISANHSFNTADNPFFRELMALIHVNGRPLCPNRDNVSKRLHALSEKAKDDLMMRLIENDSKISLALDAWTSRNNRAFLGMSLMN
jgi:hypothetical protein